MTRTSARDVALYRRVIDRLVQACQGKDRSGPVALVRASGIATLTQPTVLSRTRGR